MFWYNFGVRFGIQRLQTSGNTDSGPEQIRSSQHDGVQAVERLLPPGHDRDLGNHPLLPAAGTDVKVGGEGRGGRESSSPH